MDYACLFSFVEFAEHRNFTRAAEALHLSQPALHVQVKKLSEAVGVELYRKEGRNLHLTPEGEKLAAFGREVQQRGANVLAELTGSGRAGPLVVASGQGAFVYLLGPAIRRFPKKRWRLRLRTLPGLAAIDEVRAAKAHLAVVATREPPEDLETDRLCTVGQQVVLPASHRLAKRKRIAVKDLAHEPLVVAPSGSPHRNMLEQMFAVVGLPLQVGVEAHGWAPMMSFAKLGIGVALVNDFCTPPRGMKAVPLQGAPPIDYFAVYRPGRRFEALQVMLQTIQSEMANR